MNNKIVLGSILAVFILILLPSVSAIKFNAVVKEKINNESILFEEGLFGFLLEFLIRIITDSPIGLMLHYIISFHVSSVKTTIHP